MREKEIKFVFFDIGGVFFSFRSALDKLAKKHEKREKDMKKVFKKYDPAACKGEIAPDKLWLKYKEELNIDSPSSFNLREFWMSHLSLIRETHELAQRVSKKYPVGLLTNVYKNWYEHTFKAGFIPPLEYNLVVKSCDIGLIKPEKGIYRFAQKQVGVSSEEILFIDDTPRNIEGARRVGWQAVRFDEEEINDSLKRVKKYLNLD